MDKHYSKPAKIEIFLQFRTTQNRLALLPASTHNLPRQNQNIKNQIRRKNASSVFSKFQAIFEQFRDAA